MNRISPLIVVAIAWVIAAPAAAKDYWNNRNWSVFTLDNDAGTVACTATRLNVTQPFSMLFYKDGHWTIIISKATPVRGAYKLSVNSQQLHKGATSSPRGQLLDLGPLPPKVVQALSQGKTLELASARGRATFDLTGSADAMDQSRRCMLKAVGELPDHGLPYASGRERWFTIGINTLGYANMRNGPGLTWDVVTQIPEGTEGVERIGACVPPDDGKTINMWCPVAWNGFKGMVSATNLVGGDESEEVATTTKSNTSPPPAPSAKGTVSTGTGFYVSKDGHILTNHHVVDSCAQLTVTHDKSLPVPARVVGSDKFNDLALIKTDALPGMEPAPFGSAALGASIYVYGFPLSGILAQSGTFTIGNVSADAGINDNTSRFQISAAIQPGNSGGPVLDASGNVVGVVVGKLNALAAIEATGDVPQNVNFAIKADTARIFMGAMGITPSAVASSETLDPTAVAVRAKSFTVLIHCVE